VSIHKVSMRNKQKNKAELESQYIVRTGNKHEGETKISDTIEHEIGCPRCYNIMTLCSDFDSLYYLCEECDFSLYTLKIPVHGCLDRRNKIKNVLMSIPI
jgi:hypothetical protein